MKTRYAFLKFFLFLALICPALAEAAPGTVSDDDFVARAFELSKKEFLAAEDLTFLKKEDIFDNLLFSKKSSLGVISNNNYVFFDRNDPHNKLLLKSDGKEKYWVGESSSAIEVVFLSGHAVVQPGSLEEARKTMTIIFTPERVWLLASLSEKVGGGRLGFYER